MNPTLFQEDTAGTVIAAAFDGSDTLVPLAEPRPQIELVGATWTLDDQGRAVATLPA